jgi:hypothetical protein
MTWSRVVRSAAGLTGEIADEKVAAVTEGRVMARLTPMGWERVRELRLALTSLQVLETSGWDAVGILWEATG